MEGGSLHQESGGGGKEKGRVLFRFSVYMVAEGERGLRRERFHEHAYFSNAKSEV